ncbi:DNA-directed RNA polymerase subunit RPC12/RpoP [Desulfitispora alkaliphila]|uniref:hypothetical protein n=1 Tax=Desulfitispora alkaliphila TaxID=622674 RepID=UPI003D1AED90
MDKESKCKKCGASIVDKCPETEDQLCEKKKNVVCPECEYVELQEDDTAKCAHPEKGNA